MPFPPDPEGFTIIFVSLEREMVQEVFNSNAFPAPVRDLFDASSSKLSIFCWSVAYLEDEVERDRARFLDRLGHRQNDIASLPPNRYTLFYDGTAALSTLFLSLTSLKAFLDIYAALIARILVPSMPRMRFDRAKLKRTTSKEQISGGTLINWLRASAPRSFASRSALADMIEHHSRQWITTAVTKYRDELTHYSDIPGMLGMRVALRPEAPPFSPVDIVSATLPDGTGIVAYCHELRRNVQHFVVETIQLLPINHSLVSTDRFVLRKP